MKLLFLTSRFPYPLEKGDKLRSYYLLKELSKYHQITLIALSDVSVDVAHIQHLQTFIPDVRVFYLGKISKWFNTTKALFCSYPFQVAYFYDKTIQRQIHQIITEIKPEHIFCQLLRTASYVKDVNHIPKTLDYQDAFSHGVKRRMNKTKNVFLAQIFKMEYTKLKEFEKTIFDYFKYKIIISEADRKHIPHKEKDSIHIIKNGVDFDSFNAEAYKDDKKIYDLVFTGNMNYPPNINCANYIAKRILPLLTDEFPEIKIAFVGINPHHTVQKLQNKHIIVTGWVEDIKKYYAKSKVFLAPMQIGTGLQNKMLEAMAMKLPCVTTELVNNPIGTTHEKHLFVGQKPIEFAGFVKQLLNDEKLAETIGNNGHDFVRSHFSWAYHVKLLNEIIEGR